MVRDPDGVLRKATWEEWAKMCQIYFPRPGKQLTMPQMFQDQHLQVFQNQYLTELYVYPTLFCV